MKFKRYKLFVLILLFIFNINILFTAHVSSTFIPIKSGIVESGLENFESMILAWAKIKSELKTPSPSPSPSPSRLLESLSERALASPGPFHFFYNASHVLVGDKKGGKHFISCKSELKDIVDKSDDAKPFLKDTATGVMNGYIKYHNDKFKFSTIFPIDDFACKVSKDIKPLKEEFHENLLLFLNNNQPFAKAKRNSLLFKFNDYLINSYLQSSESLKLSEKLKLAPSIFPIFGHRSLTDAEVLKIKTIGVKESKERLTILKYEKYEQDKFDFGNEKEASISYHDLYTKLNDINTKKDVIKKYFYACTKECERVILNIPYDFLKNKISNNFDSGYFIYLELPLKYFLKKTQKILTEICNENEYVFKK